MKRLALILTLLLVGTLVMGSSCHKNPPPAPPEQQTTRPADTTPPPPPPPPTTTEEKPQIQESQFQTVYFDFDKYNLRSDGKAALDANGNLLKEFPSAIIRIEGHCDERGTVEYNLSLGEKRARSCMDYLSGMGIDAGRMSIISYGEERPAAQGTGEEVWAQNRRAEFRIVSQ